MLSKEEILKQFDVYEEHVKRYDAEYRKSNKLPKNHAWRPYRWCSKDIVFALMVVRHERFRNCLEVDVCLMANPPQYFENSGPRVAMSFLLSEAYKCGTSMEIVFTKNVEPRVDGGVVKGRVPAYIYDLSRELNIKLKHVMEGHITPFEARQMYMELVGFSKETQARIMQMSVDGVISPERVCFLVMGGVWSVPEMEAIILGSKNPTSLLLSASVPEDRMLYLNDLLISRGAILGGALDRKLLKKELVENGQIVESEDEQTDLEISFDGEFYAKVYKLGEEIVVPWTENETILKASQLMVVSVRAWSGEELSDQFEVDMENLKALIEKYQKIDSEVRVYYLVTRDFENISESKRQEMSGKVSSLRVVIMVSPESVRSLDKEAGRRIETGRMVRHE